MDHLNIFAQTLLSCSFQQGLEQILEMKEIPVPQVNLLGSSVSPVVSIWNRNIVLHIQHLLIAARWHPAKGRNWCILNKGMA